MNQELFEKVDEHFGFMFEDGLVKDIATVGQLRRVREGQTLMDVGDAFTHMPLVIEGAIKILREDKDGNELLLYYLEGGDTCAMSLSCCMGQKKSKIRAIAEEDSLLVMVPVEYLDRWITQYQSWKAYIFESIRVRMDEFIESIDSLAFMQMDERLLKYLRDRVRVIGSPEITTTHQQIANDLHTSRVVISRLIKQLETAGKVKLGRNHLEVLEL
jgi:CRP/FNR family transcriptional regulator, anaerobic regulatory protein